MAEPGSIAEKVKQQADIVRIVGDYVRLKKAGQNFMGLCPFHPEKTPSFAVHPVKQFYHCFGCGVGGDVFQFVMEIDKLTFPEALRAVADKIGIPLPERRPRTPEEATATRLRTLLVELHEHAARFFAQQLLQTKEGALARAYLNDRGLTDEVMRTFELGYAPGTGDALLRKLREIGYKNEVLQASGLVNRDDRGAFYDRFRRRVVFPIANERGKVVAFGGRALGEDMPKYLNSPETPIYSKSRILYNLHRAKEALRRQDYAVLVEGYLDCIAVHTAGVGNVVATCGTSLTDLQVQLLGRSTRNLVVSFDPDAAGAAATERSLNLVLEQGFQVRVLTLEPGTDPDSFVRQKGAEAYREKLKDSLRYIDYLLLRVRGLYDLKTQEGKVAALNHLLPYLARVPNRIQRAEWVKPVADGLGIDDALLLQELKRAVVGRVEKLTMSERLQRPAAKTAERRLLKIFLDQEEFRPDLAKELADSGAHRGTSTERIFEACLSALASGGPLEVSALAEGLEEAERKLLFEIALESGAPGTLEEARSCLAALEAKQWEQQLRGLNRRIEEASRQGNAPEKGRLLREKQELTQRWQAFRRLHHKDTLTP